jgi:hypothetical protein
MAIQVSTYNKKIFCDQNVGKKDDVNKFTALNISEKVQSIQEMAESLHESNVNSGKNYNFIMVCGHAGPGVQGLGSNRGANYRKGRDFAYNNLEDINNEITKIAASLDTTQPIKPVLFLGGCGAGDEKKGSLLLKQLSAKLQNVLIVASKDHLTFRQSCIEKSVVSVEILTLVKGKPSNVPPEFKFSFNGQAISEAKLLATAGVDADTLRTELTNFNKV